MSKFQIDDNRVNWFTRRLHTSNKFEALRIHRTYVKDGKPYVCREHVDDKNSKCGTLSAVLWWSALVEWEGIVMRIGVVGYWRSSIDDYFQRQRDHSRYLLVCRDALLSFGPERRTFLHTNLAGREAVPGFEFLPITRSRCNLKIESFYQLFVAMLSSFLTNYPLTSLNECVSVLMAVARTLCSASFTSVAIRMLLAECPNCSDKGWWLVRKFALMDSVHEQEDMTLSLRFGKYTRFYNLEDDEGRWTKHDWKEVVGVITAVFESVRRTEKPEQEDYNRLQRNIQRIPGVGTLSANHIIGIAAIVGILPLSLFPMVSGGADKFINDLEGALQQNNAMTEAQRETNATTMAVGGEVTAVTMEGQGGMATTMAADGMMDMATEVDHTMDTETVVDGMMGSTKGVAHGGTMTTTVCNGMMTTTMNVAARNGTTTTAQNGTTTTTARNGTTTTTACNDTTTTTEGRNRMTMTTEGRNRTRTSATGKRTAEEHVESITTTRRSKKQRKKKKKKTLPSKKIVIENVRYLAEVVLDVEAITEREGENDCCKVGCYLLGSDGRFWDIGEHLFPTFEVNSKGDRIFLSDNRINIGSIFDFDGSKWVSSMTIPRMDTKRRRWMHKYLD